MIFPIVIYGYNIKHNHQKSWVKIICCPWFIMLEKWLRTSSIVGETSSLLMSEIKQDWLLEGPIMKLKCWRSMRLMPSKMLCCCVGDCCSGTMSFYWDGCMGRQAQSYKTSEKFLRKYLCHKESEATEQLSCNNSQGLKHNPQATILSPHNIKYQQVSDVLQQI